MKKFEVEISLYPQTYTVEAENESDAIEKAKIKFDEYNNGKSIYAIESVVESER